MSIMIGLHQTKDPANLANVRRVVSCYGGGKIQVTGSRLVTRINDAMNEKDRLPRPLRDRRYDNAIIKMGLKDFVIPKECIPVSIEVTGSTNIAFFEHPQNAFYIFGPEDGSIPPQISKLCHHHVVIPTLHCLNLAVAVSTVLYDRMAKQWTHMSI